jgi:hypothetical protein
MEHVRQVRHVAEQARSWRHDRGHGLSRQARGQTMIVVAILIALVVAIGLVLLWLFQWEGESDPSWW